MSYHPLFDSLGVAFLTVLILGFTPTSSLLRIACLPILGSSWASAVGGYTLSLFCHYLDVAILSRWSYENRGKSITPGAFSEVAYRMKFGFSTLFSWRFINTPDQVRNIPPLKEDLRSSKARFISHTAAIIIVCYLLLDAMDSSSDTVPEFYSVDKISMLARIQDVSLEELIMRFFAAVGLGVGLVSFQRGVYSIAAFFCVAIGLSSPADWPPFNGSVLKISSLRYFWSTFWHQTNTHRLRTFSNFFIHDVLRIRKNTKLARFLRVWVVFFISGVMHVAIDFSAGIPVQDSGALRFFLIQPLGIIVEDVTGTYVSPVTSRYRIVQRCLGFIWVGLWMAWTAPGYLYPIINKSDPGDGGVVPVSIISYVKRLIEEL